MTSGCDLLSSADVDATNEFAGGTTTVKAEFSNAYQFPAANLSAEEIEAHRQADVVFESIFVTAPSAVNGGLGPIFNQNSCASCHAKNGRSAFPTSEDLGGLLFRLSSEGVGAHGEPLAVANFGDQLQTKAIYGKQPEGNVQISFSYMDGKFPDGQSYTLRKPNYTISQTYTLMPAHTQISPRIAPPVFGLGLLEAIPEAEILKNVDEVDANQDGVSGRANYVWSHEQQKNMLGRFGWKANQPTLYQQTASAYLGDMGITSPLFKEESFKNQVQHDGLADDPEIDDKTLKLATYYTQSLAVPASRRQKESEIQKGRSLFKQVGCETCHRASFVTSPQAQFPFLSDQTIYPYTDLLLHDMGEELADNRPDFLASGREWRTPPLWGIGLTEVVSGHTHFLHDGRARTLQEAILWHGGEAEKSLTQYKKLSKKERDMVLAFLNTL
jgi:CxxC motif-containing protein (DUF1111 family)